MKTRIIHTNIHEDEWISTLPMWKRYMFIWFFTNPRIGHTGFYKVSDRVIQFETGATLDELMEVKKDFEEAKKVFFKDGWILVVKSALYGGYNGPKNEDAYKKEFEAIPITIRSYFSDRVSIEYRYSMDTTINNKSKSETINNKSGEERIGDYVFKDGKAIKIN